jgi:NADH-quinone oxidoreductase subunit M
MVVAMMDGSIVSLLLTGVPLLGSLLSLTVWSKPDRLKVSAIIWSIMSLAANVGLAGRLTTPPEGPLLLYLLPLAACASLLGQPVHRDHRLSWIMTLLFLGLGLGVLTNHTVAGRMFLLVLLGSLIVLLSRHHTPLWPISWWGIGTYGLGALCVGVSVIAGPPLSAVASLLTCAILLPLVPFHDGHLTALTRLPGSLPSFIVLLFPAVGLHGLATVVSTVPEVVAWTVSLLALAGSLFGAIKALAQSRVRLLLAYGSLSFFSMLWWFVTATRTATPRVAVFVSAVGLVTSGLLLAWQVIRTRYGDDVDPQAISGLVATMPRYAVLVSLLAVAAMGLPPFGLFAGFMGLLLSSTASFSIAVIIMVTVWLAASWYIMGMVQQWLFGEKRTDLRYTDLLPTESASLLILILVLLALGVAPSNLFGPERTTPSTSTTVESIVWNK